MPGKIVERMIHDVIDSNSLGKWPNQKTELSLNGYTKTHNKDNTILLVVAPGQEQYGIFLESCKEIKVVYKSKKAVNMNYKDDGPRNTLYVVEYV